MVSRNPKLVLIIGFISITCLLIGILTAGLQRMVTIGDKLKQVVNEDSVKTSMIQTMSASARERSILLQKIVQQEDPFIREQLIDTLYELGGRYMKSRERLKSFNIQESELVFLGKQAQLTAEVTQLQYQVIELARTGQQKDALLLLNNHAIPAQDKVIYTLNELAALQVTHSRQILEEANRAYQEARGALLLLSIPILFAGIVIIGYVVRRISAMTSDLQSNSNQLASTNLVLESKVRELSQAQKLLSSSEAHERAIRENMLDAVITIDERGIIDSCNPAAESLFGYSSEELLGANVSLLMPEPYSKHHSGYIERYMNSGRSDVLGMPRDLSGQHKDGHIFPLDIGITRISLDGKIKIVGILRDITVRRDAEKALQRSRDDLEQLVEHRTAELIAANERLQHLASYDSLTNLPNRTMFQEHLKMAAAQARRSKQLLAVMFLDLDGFKFINDNYGHEAGDFLLKQVAKKLKSNLREEDTVARLGGDEFVLVLGGLSSDQYAAQVASKLLTELAMPIIWNEKNLVVSVSIGISIYPLDSDDLTTLLGEADKAMYQVKRSGKNHYEFFHNIQDNTLEES